MKPAGELSGVSVLVTRPAAQAQGLCDMIASAGGEPVPFPVMAIRPIPARIPELMDLDWLVFISTNAVKAFFDQLSQPLPTELKVAVIGAKTAHALQQLGVGATLIPPSPYTSEALLQLPDWQKVQGRRVLIVRGVGGRETLRETLEQRGAQVEYCEVYRRELPEADARQLLTRWRDRGIDLVTVSSNEGLANLAQLLGPEGTLLLRQTPIVAINARMAGAIRAQGWRLAPGLADNATDEAVFRAIRHWVRDHAK